MSGRLSSAGRSSDLGARRRLRRRRGLIAFGILILALLAGGLYELHRPFARISRVQVFGADQSLADIATSAMQGSYLGIIPRDSTLFYPASTIRADILAAHPDYAAVSLFRSGLSGITIRIDTRAPVARWCGAPPTAIRFNTATSSPGIATVVNCYVFDAGGIVYATTTKAQLVNSFVVYESPESEIVSIGSVLPNANALPAVFDFARQLSTFGSPVVAVVLHDGEVDAYLANRTRVSYVLGHEQDAFDALVSARANLKLSDGSIDYVDLRFDGKVYLKRKSDTVK